MTTAPNPTTSTEHTTSLESAGSYYSWSCTCGKTSRRLQPLYKADRNAKAHVRKHRNAAPEQRMKG